MKPFKFEIDEESDASIIDFGCKMKSIIDLYCEETAAKLDGEILSAVHKVGINVDKERLLKALTDARTFYEEGYADGKADAQQKWIPVTERLPEGSDNVLVCHKNGYVTTNNWLVTEWWYKNERNPITHWMPLPEAPKEGE